MALSLSGGLFQDQNSSAHFNGASVGKTNGFKAKGNRGLGARKPLGDLSNAVTPASTLVSKKQNLNTFSFAEEMTGGVSKKKITVSKDKEKAPKIGRKALSDISNSAKPHSHHTSKKNQNVKLSALSEESTVVEERFLHNHHDCIKAQMKAIDMDEFLQTIGLDKGFHKQSASPWPSSLSSKSKLESPLKYLELDEMDEPTLEDQFTLKTELSEKLHSPPCRTPKSTSHFVRDFDFVLAETPPKLSKR